MPLSEEEKQALKEKYKEQRQAMWAGERSTLRPSSEDPEEESDNQAEPVISSRREADDVTLPTDTMSSDSQADPSLTEAAQERPSIQSDSHAEEQAPASNLAQGTGDEENASQAQQAVVSEDPSPTPDEADRIREKIREQREGMWEGQSSVHSRRTREQGTASEGEREFWEESENKGKPSVLTWKLALGVVGGVIVLIGVGVLLGYWFAS